MSSVNNGTASADSVRSSSLSEKSLEGSVSVHDQAIAHEDPERNASPEIFPTALRSISSRAAASIQTTGTNNPDFEVDWDDDNDPMNPRNWPVWYKGLTIFFISWSTWCVAVYSTSYTTGIVQMQANFHISSEPVATLGVTSYLFGLAVGSMIVAPLSEMYGRRPVYIITMFIFTILYIPCALATSLAEVVVVRFFAAIAGSAMVANSPGSVSDIVTDEYRALAFSIWALGPLNGPTFGPLIGGFSTQYLGWRWTNWIVMMFSGFAFVFMCILKETYTPTILKKKAELRRKEENDDRYWSRYDERKLKFLPVLKVNLSRPFVMIFTEPICLFWDIYVATIYGILYLCFVAYPLVFTRVRGWSNGMTGLSFLGLLVGCFIVIGAEPLIRRMINAHKKDPETGKVPPEAMVSVVCIAAVLAPIGELWFAWTCVPPVHWIWPILAGIPFGAGNTLVFIYATNYLAQSYGVYAASALAGNSVLRSILGGTLPLAGPSMYARLGPHWAGTLLAFIQIAIIPIPVVFYMYGAKIRVKSVLIKAMQEDKEKLESKRRSGITVAKRNNEEEEIVKIASRPAQP